MTKRWPPEHFAALARRAGEMFGGTIFLVGGAEETAAATAVRRGLSGPSRDLTGRTTLPQLAALLECADVMLANDTGPLHLAAALGRPVIAPYTCTKVRRSGPYNAERGAVETTVPCGGSYKKRCARLECMTELTPDRLWPFLAEVLRSWQSRENGDALHHPFLADAHGSESDAVRLHKSDCTPRGVIRGRSDDDGLG